MFSPQVQGCLNHRGQVGFLGAGVGIIGSDGGVPSAPKPVDQPPNRGLRQSQQRGDLTRLPTLLPKPEQGLTDGNRGGTWHCQTSRDQGHGVTTPQNIQMSRKRSSWVSGLNAQTWCRVTQTRPRPPCDVIMATGLASGILTVAVLNLNRPRLHRMAMRRVGPFQPADQQGFQADSGAARNAPVVSRWAIFARTRASGSDD